MRLRDDFQFSQAVLQDYVDCRRRFQLRHVEQVAWPAIQTEPMIENERRLQQGQAFHRLVHQHALGIPVERLTETVSDSDLKVWWENYLLAPPQDLPGQRYPELLLSAPLAGYRLVAKYDLVAVEAGERAVIVDWKTSRYRPGARGLQERLQTRVYPYLLIVASHDLNGGRRMAPEQVEMVYWFASNPGAPERFAYSSARYAEDSDYLTGLISEIMALKPAEFVKTDQVERCKYCRYRSLCDRGEQAGLSFDLEDGFDDGEEIGLSLDLEHIAEIEL